MKDIVQNFQFLKSKIMLFQGGFSYIGRLKLVEAFDHNENRWIFLIYMNESRIMHSLTKICNKLFVIGKNNIIFSEVYDSVSRKFTMFSLKVP